MLREGIDKVTIDENNKATNVSGSQLRLKLMSTWQKRLKWPKGKLLMVAVTDPDIVWATADINRFKPFPLQAGHLTGKISKRNLCI